MRGDKGGENSKRREKPTDVEIEQAFYWHSSGYAACSQRSARIRMQVLDDRLVDLLENLQRFSCLIQ